METDKLTLDAEQSRLFQFLNRQAADAAQSVKVQEALLHAAQQNAETTARAASVTLDYLRKVAGVMPFERYTITEENGNVVIIPTREPQAVNPAAGRG